MRCKYYSELQSDSERKLKTSVYHGIMFTQEPQVKGHMSKVKFWQTRQVCYAFRTFPRPFQHNPSLLLYNLCRIQECNSFIFMGYMFRKDAAEEIVAAFGFRSYPSLTTTFTLSQTSIIAFSVCTSIHQSATIYTKSISFC